MRQKVFISRNEEDIPVLTMQIKEAGFDLIAKSMINFESVLFDKTLPNSDWIFFSSASAVRHFFNQNPLINNQKFGVIGEGTANELKKYGIPDFVGDSINTLETAERFYTNIGERIVLFPGSENSLRNIQSVFPPKQVVDLICYRTIAAPAPMGFPDILIFSSPSNVHAYLLLNHLNPHQKVIAFGHSTAKALQESGVNDIIIPESLSDEGLLKAINRISVS